MEKALTNQKKFQVTPQLSHGRETGPWKFVFNFYQIEPQSISDKYGIVIFSLLFYVIYTLWYGFAIMFMFEGWGMKMEH